ncbi:unnamed protein product [Heterobilharzia americana]|nr:unnamed protein product [Heterobilharzia americana]
MLDVCRDRPYLSRAEFIHVLFPTTQPNLKATYLIKLVLKHYNDPMLNRFNFRMCLVHASMLLFPASPNQAFHYATKAYNNLNNSVENEMKDWEISRSDAAELLAFAFGIQNDDTVKRVLDCAYFIRDSVLSNYSVHSDFSAHGISGHYLYEGLLGQLPDLANCYVHYDTEIRKVFKGRRRPLVESSSTSESNLNELMLAQTTSFPSSSTHIYKDNKNTTNQKNNLIVNNFECIDITEIPSSEIIYFKDKFEDIANLSSSSQNDNHSSNIRRRLSERRM